MDFVAALLAPPLAWLPLAMCGATLAAAYAVFGLTGFGATLLALPILVLWIPLTQAVPMLLIFDLGATLAIRSRSRGALVAGEVLRLFPGMVLGIGAGVSVLVGLDAKPLLLGLGLFVVANALWNLKAPAWRGAIGPWWAMPAGLFGGAFGGLFGSGGPIYSIYLGRRIDDMTRLRATTAAVIMTSALTRIGLFTGVGLYAKPGLWQDVLWFAPCAALGVALGMRAHTAWPPERLKRALALVLLAGGVGSLIKGLAA
jgi:hypothetical protein